jgi:hypothetical protein
MNYWRSFVLTVVIILIWITGSYFLLKLSLVFENFLSERCSELYWRQIKILDSVSLTFFWRLRKYWQRFVYSDSTILFYVSSKTTEYVAEDSYNLQTFRSARNRKNNIIKSTYVVLERFSNAQPKKKIFCYFRMLN